MGTSSIGSGGDYATIPAWVAAEVTGVLTEDVIGECKAELFSGTVTISGATPGAYWVHLWAESGAEHDGRGNHVSGAGNARTVSSATNFPIEVAQNNVEIAWMEVYTEAALYSRIIYFSGTRTNLRVRHNILRPNSLDQLAAAGCWGDGTSTVITNGVMYRNIGYGGGRAMGMSTGDTSTGAVLLNSVYSKGFNNGVGEYHGIFVGGTMIVENNAVFASTPGSDISINGSATKDSNATSDTSGEAGLQNLTASDNFKDVSAFAAMDLRILDATADIYQAADTTYSTATYPEIDVPISDRTAVVTGTWSIGADDVTVTPTPTPMMESILLASAFCIGPF